MTTFTKVNELEFNSKNFSATISIKIGNLIKEILFKYNSYSEEITYNTDSINNLIEAGMEFDFSELKGEFTKLVYNQLEIEKQKKILKAEELYNDAWFQNLPQIDEVVIILPNKEQYIEKTLKGYYSSLTGIYLKYKNEKWGIDYVNTNSANYGAKIMKYQLVTQPNSQRRNYSTFESAVKKFKELVDEKLKNEEVEKRGLIEKANREEAFMNLIHDTFLSKVEGWELKVESKWIEYMKSSQRVFNLSHKNQSSKVISKGRKLNLETRSFDENGVQTWDFAGLSEITEEQVLTVLRMF